MKFRSIALALLLCLIGNINLQAEGLKSPTTVNVYPYPFNEVPKFVHVNKELLEKFDDDPHSLTPVQFKIVECSIEADQRGLYMHMRQEGLITLNDILTRHNPPDRLVQVIALIYQMPVGNTVENRVNLLNRFVEDMYTACMAR